MFCIHLFNLIDNINGIDRLLWHDFVLCLDVYLGDLIM